MSEELDSASEVDRLRGRGNGSAGGAGGGGILSEGSGKTHTTSVDPRVLKFETRDHTAREAHLAEMARNREYVAKCYAEQAWVQRQYFNSLVSQGFTEDQALRLLEAEYLQGGGD